MKNIYLFLLGFGIEVGSVIALGVDGWKTNIPLIISAFVGAGIALKNIQLNQEKGLLTEGEAGKGVYPPQNSRKWKRKHWRKK